MANLTACWISAVRIATVVSMSDLDFSDICVSIRSSRVFRKASQSVYLLYRDGFCCCRMTRVCKVIKIGVWSDEFQARGDFRFLCVNAFCYAEVQQVRSPVCITWPESLLTRR